MLRLGQIPTIIDHFFWNWKAFNIAEGFGTTKQKYLKTLVPQPKV